MFRWYHVHTPRPHLYQNETNASSSLYLLTLRCNCLAEYPYSSRSTECLNVFGFIQLHSAVKVMLSLRMIEGLHKSRAQWFCIYINIDQCIWPSPSSSSSIRFVFKIPSNAWGGSSSFHIQFDVEKSWVDGMDRLALSVRHPRQCECLICIYLLHVEINLLLIHGSAIKCLREHI